MRLSYRYRLYPLRPQLPLLERHRTELAALGNHALAQRQDAWRKERRSVSYLDQQRDLTRWRNYDRDGLGQVSVRVAQDCLQRLDLAFRAFFRRITSGERRPGYPHYRRSVDSFTYTPGSNPVVSGPHQTWRVKVPKVGEIPLRLHRPLPDDAKVRTVTVRSSVGEWFATLSLDVPDPPPPLPQCQSPMHPVGVDLGVAAALTLSTGERIESPRFWTDMEFRMRSEQRRLSRKQKGSHRYERQRGRVARCHARVRRQREWSAHQVSHDLAERFDLVAFEDVEASELVEGNPLANRILNSVWGSVRSKTAYWERVRRGRCVEVPTQGTTQTCSSCGRLALPPLLLSDRVYHCGGCGHEEDRDVNAARNVLNRGMTLLEREPRGSATEVRRGESGPPPRRVGRRAYPARRVGSRNREVRIGSRVIIEPPKFVFRRLKLASIR